MNDDTYSAPPSAPPSARLRPRRWLTTVWLVPLLAAVLVGALAVRSLADRGPLITIVFTDAEGLEAGNTPIRHKDVDLGTVESIHLSADLSQVIVRARMRHSISASLTSGTRFWIVRPRVGLEGISGLSTLVSGSYIEMYPGHGAPQRQFSGLPEPPVLTPDTPGRSFTLHVSNLGSLMAGSPISYRGVQVGQIQGYSLSSSGPPISLYAFVRAPYEKLVNAQSRFWNSGGLDVSIGADGVRFRAESWQALISGGVSFDTPDSAAGAPESTPGTVFQLYDNQTDAQRQPRGPTLQYVVEFRGASGAVAKDSAVTLLGSEVGRVTASRLQYDDRTQSLLSRVTLEIDPSRVQIVHGSALAAAPSTAALNQRVQRLVRHGLRARLMAANVLTGTLVVSLDMLPDAPPAQVDTSDGLPRLPSVASADLSSLLASAQGTLQHVAAATAGPELRDAVSELDRTMTHLDQASATLAPQIEPVMTSLRATLQATQHTLGAANQVLGNGAASTQDLPHLIRELTQTARSTRDLTDYLDRHPEALLRGRKADQ